MYEYNCEIVRVVDGDTVDVNIDLGFGVWMRNERVRLYGIDTPESRTRDKTEKVFGKLATAIVEHFLPKDSTRTQVTVKDNIKTDSQMFLNDWMVRELYAVEYTGQSKGSIVDAHLENYQKLFENPDVAGRLRAAFSQEEFEKYLSDMRNSTTYYD